MKFCKNLQQIVEISDPEWAPYWTNYRMLKKLIKELPSLLPNTENASADSPSTSPPPSAMGVIEESKEEEVLQDLASIKKETRKENMGKSPGEIAFFKLLHAELIKATTFFEKAKQEFAIREERVREGIEIFRKPNMILVTDKWSIMAKSIYRLYKDLLLLELYAIMTYTSFSKILKKHDKVTGYETRIAFMGNVVNKASFVHYPDLLGMIQRAQKLFEEVSQKLLIEGNTALGEDEKLFISMIHRFYGQIMDKAAEEGAPDAEKRCRRKLGGDNESIQVGSLTATEKQFSPYSHGASSLKKLVDENDATKRSRNVMKTTPCLSDDSDDILSSKRQKTDA